MRSAVKSWQRIVYSPSPEQRLWRKPEEETEEEDDYRGAPLFFQLTILPLFFLGNCRTRQALTVGSNGPGPISNGLNS